MRISNLLKRFYPRNSGFELPEYSALRSAPTRGLPPDLRQEESGDSFTARRGAIERAMIESDARLRMDLPLFIEMLAGDKGGLLTITLPGTRKPCLPVFTTPFRAADYKRTLLTSEPSIQYLSSTAEQLTRMLHDIQEEGITSLALDRCPRCSLFTIVETSSLKQDQDLLRVRAIHKATELARLELYITYALNSAKEGQLEKARNVALETVGHVNFENPRPHLLLGELGVALGDDGLLREAQEFLRFFKHDSWSQRLTDIARSGQPQFEQPDLTGRL